MLECIGFFVAKNMCNYSKFDIDFWREMLYNNDSKLLGTFRFVLSWRIIYSLEWQK